MDAGFALIARLFESGAGNLAAYLAAHVLLCLLPAFFIAGGMTALIPKDAITRFLGRTTRPAVSYPAAAAAGSLLAVCSCTIVPLFAGIYRKGAGIGPAFTFLFFAPAANILALVYTSAVIGPDLAFARLSLSLAFGIGIGLVMALVFSADDAERDRSTDALFASQNGAGMSRAALAFIVLWVVLLLAGTLKLPFLTEPIAQFTLPFADTRPWQAAFDRLVPFDRSRGEEGVSVQGALLIGLLAAIAVCAWRGLEGILDGFNGWTRAALVLIAITLLVAGLVVESDAAGLAIGVPGKVVAIAACLALVAAIARRGLPREDVQSWLWESWRFVKQIFPLLVAGVFVVGMLRVLVQPEWIEMLAGRNTVAGNLAGVAFGVFMYFPTLVEVPVARMFLDLGMHRGPLLAYLMADPELSLQSILILTAIAGRRKTWTYVGLVALFSAAAGLAYGAWIDGTSTWILAASVIGFVVVLALVVRRAGATLSIHRPQEDQA